MDLGVLCPCLVTMQPLLHHGFVYISSQLSPRNRSRVERITGTSVLPPRPPKVHGDENASSHTQLNSDKSLRSKPSRLEEGGAQWYDSNQSYQMDDMPEPVPKAVTKDAGGTLVSQGAALASLDPRVNTSSHAQVERGPGGNTPEGGIGVAKDWKLESEKAKE